MELILETKFILPTLLDDTVIRYRLFDQLSLGLKKKLSLICAGCGCGKSVLLSSFLKTTRQASINYPVPFVWYKLDEDDKNTSLFLSNLITAINQSFLYPDNKKKKVSANFKNGWMAALSDVFNEILNRRHEKLLIILDDFHFVDNNIGMKELISYFISNSPANLHLIISSRHIPSFTMPKQRADGNMHIFKNNDFAFNLFELEVFLQTGFQIYLPKQYLEVFLNYTGGWIAGIRLLAEAIAGKEVKDIDNFKALLKDSGATVSQYLSEEFFDKLEDDMKGFLLETSLLERFSVPLCKEVISKPLQADINELINTIKDMDFLISVSLDKARWYKYHEIFSTFLKEQLYAFFSKDKIADMHKRAARWYRNNEYWQQACRHYISSGDYDEVGKTIELLFPIIINTNAALELNSILSLIPMQIIEDSTTFLAAHGFSRFILGQNDMAINSLIKAKDRAIIDNNKYLILISFDYLIQAYHGMELYEDMKNCALEGLDNMTEDYYIGFVIMSTYLANSHIYLNNPSEAKNIWMSIKSSSLFENKNSLFQNRLSMDCINILIALGDINNAVIYAKRAVDHDKINNDPRYGLSLASLALVRLEMGYYQESYELFEAAISELKSRHMIYAVDSVLNLSAINSSFIGDIDKFRSQSDRAVIAHCQEDQTTKGFFRTSYYKILSVFKCFYERNDEAFFIEAEEVVRQTAVSNRYHEIYETYCWIAPMYAYLGDIETGIDLLLKVIEICRQNQSPYGQARARLIIASLYLKIDRLEDFKLHIESSLLISENNGYDYLFLNKERSAALKVLPFCLSNQINLKYSSRLLTKMGRDCANDVICSLKDKNKEVKKSAINILIEMRYRDVESDLIELLKDSDKEICKCATIGLQRISLLPAEPLRVYTFGKFTAFVGDRKIVENSWKRKTAKSFFKYFVFNAGKDITLEKLEEIFFNDKSVENAKLNIRQGISSLRRVLEPGITSRRDSSYLKALNGSYCFEFPEGSYIDFIEFNRLLIEAVLAKKDGDSYRAISIYNKTISLYNGDVFDDDHVESWADIVRAYYLDRYKEAMSETARLYFEVKEYNKSIEALKTLLSKDSWHERSYLLLMKCYLAIGEKTKAVEVYRRCSNVLIDELNINPSKQIIDLYKSMVNISG